MLKGSRVLLLSFVILNLFNWVTVVELRYGIPQIIKYLLSVSSLGALIWYWIKNRSKPIAGVVFYSLIFFFVLWSSILLITSVLQFDDLFYVQRVFGQRFFFIPYLLPIIILFSRFEIDFFGLYFRIAALLLIPAFLVQLFIIASGMDKYSWFEQTTRIFIFDIGSSFVLLTAHLVKKKFIQLIVVGYYFVFVFLWAFYGRRGMLVEYILLLLMMLIIIMRSNRYNRPQRMRIYFIGWLMIILLVAFGYLFTSTYAFQRGFSRSAFEESRGLIMQDFFNDFNSVQDWLIGRGLLGTIARNILGHESAGFIENGFLNILLKGGFVYSIPFILILLRASYLGLYNSKNELTKALALIILVHIIMMVYFNLPDFSPKYILTWIAASACFNPSLRKATDEDFYKAVNLKKTKIH